MELMWLELRLSLVREVDFIIGNVVRLLTLTSIYIIELFSQLSRCGNMNYKLYRLLLLSIRNRKFSSDANSTSLNLFLYSVIRSIFLD